MDMATIINILYHAPQTTDAIFVNGRSLLVYSVRQYLWAISRHLPFRLPLPLWHPGLSGLSNV